MLPSTSDTVNFKTISKLNGLSLIIPKYKEVKHQINRTQNA